MGWGRPPAPLRGRADRVRRRRVRVCRFSEQGELCVFKAPLLSSQKSGNVISQLPRVILKNINNKSPLETASPFSSCVLPRGPDGGRSAQQEPGRDPVTPRGPAPPPPPRHSAGGLAVRTLRAAERRVGSEDAAASRLDRSVDDPVRSPGKRPPLLAPQAGAARTRCPGQPLRPVPSPVPSPSHGAPGAPGPRAQ